MPEDKVAKIPHDLYQKAKDMAQAENITIAEAVSRLVETGWSQPSVCELVQFRKVLEARGITPPKRPDWIWGVTNILPADMLAGTKLQPYAEARQEAELTCSIGDELYDKLVEKATSEPILETSSPEVAETKATKTEPVTESSSGSQDTSLDADAEGEAESLPLAEAETPEVKPQEPAEPIKEELRK